MNLQLWTLYASAAALLCLTPGPNSLLAIANGARFGVRRTLFSTLGCAAGLTLLIAASLSGLGLVLAASEAVFSLIKWLGACYLIYLGVSLMRSRSTFADALGGTHAAAPRSRKYLFAQGFWIVAMNPKALIFFTAFLPQFYVVNESFWPQFAAMAGTFVAIEVLIEVLLACFAYRLAGLAGSSAGMRIFNTATGGVFVLAGTWLLTLERPK